MGRETNIGPSIRPLNDKQKSYPLILHVAVLSALVLPVALIPYFAARRHINKLRKTADLLEKNIRHLRADIDATIARQALTSTQLACLHTSMGSRFNASRDHWRVQRPVAANDGLQDDLTELKRELHELRYYSNLCFSSLTLT